MTEESLASPAEAEPLFARADFAAYLQLWRRLLGFFAGFAVVSTPALVVYCGLLQQVGEILTTRQLAAISRGEPALWHSAYYHGGILRPAIAAQLQPRVAVIGSSRVMQIRNGMFGRVPAEDFYIAGTSGNYSLPCLTTLKQLTRSERKPELVIWGLDFWWFQTPTPPEQQTAGRIHRWVDHGAYRQLREVLCEGRMQGTYALDVLQSVQQAWRDARLYAALSAPGVDGATGRKLHSVQARLSHAGYRNDGSYYYGDTLRHFAAAGIRDNGNDGRWKDTPYTGNHISSAALEDLRAFIAECRAAGTQLVVFVPPIHPDAMRHLAERSDCAGFWRQFAAEARAICDAGGVPFHDHTDARPLMAAGGNFFDWYHPSEKLSARMLLTMMNDAPTRALLAPYLDADDLARRVRQRENDFQLFDD